MRRFMAGVVLTLVCAAAAAYAYFALGLAPVATNAAEMPFEARLAGMALHARIAKEAPKTVPIETTESNPPWHLPPQNAQLMPEYQNLSCEPSP